MNERRGSETQRSELLDIQRKMAAAIMHPLTGGDNMARRRRDGARNRSEAESIIRPNDRLTSFERLEIYNRMYWFRLYSCFEEDFPGLKAVLGSAKFEKLMREYLTACPSESFTLRNLGSRLTAWLEEHPEYMEPRRQLAMDMARLEWAHIEAFDSASEELLDPDDLMEINDESRLRLQPYLRVLGLRYPVDDLLIDIQSESGSSDAASNNASAARKTKHVRRVAMLEPQEIFLAVHRQENSVYYKRLEREEFRLLRALLDGNTISEAIDAALEGSAMTEDERGAFLQQAFAGWAQLGWFPKQTST